MGRPVARIFVVLNPFTSITAGGNVTVTVTEIDQLGNIISDDNDPIDLTSSDSKIVLTSQKLAGGTCTFTVAFSTAGTHSRH